MMGKLKAEDRAEQGNGLPKKKKRKVVLEETIKESEEESKGGAKAEAEAEEANRRFETEWVRAHWVITTEMHLTQEKVASKCAKFLS